MLVFIYKFIEQWTSTTGLTKPVTVESSVKEELNCLIE